MKPQLLRVGNSQSPVVIIDDFSGALDDILAIAEALAPYPPSQGNRYPGVRRMIGETDRGAYAYVRKVCEAAAPFVGGGFGVDSFDLDEASFSVVTTAPDQLEPAQRVPHFDSSEQNLIAVLHYLRVPLGSGTAFYRHRSTGIERITARDRDRFIAAAEQELAALGKPSDYMQGSDAVFEEIERVDAVPDRLIMYHGSLFHSGVIPHGMSFSPDPRQGRLTANIFINGRSST